MDTQPTESQHEPKTKTHNQLVQPTQIDDLCDDVLQETFRYLDTFELTIVAEVCKKFKRNAQTVFSFQQKNMTAEFKITARHSVNHNISAKLISIRRLPSVLENFGPFLFDLEISLEYEFKRISKYTPAVVKWLVQYCGETLNSLKLWHFVFDTETISEFQPLLRRLQKFSLNDCQFKTESNFSEIFSCASELREIKITQIFDYDGEHYVNFKVRVNIPKLEALAIHEYEYGISTATIDNFLVMNPQLKQLDIHNYNYNDDDSESYLFETMAQYTPHMEKLRLCCYFPTEFNNFIEKAKNLKHLTALKSLDIDCQGDPFSVVISELVAANIPLESLTMSNFIVDQELVIGVSRLTRLRKLEFEGSEIKMSYVLEIVKHLPEIIELIIEMLINPPTESASDLVEIVKSAPKLKFMHFNANYGVNYGENWNFDEIVYRDLLDVVSKRGKGSSLKLVLRRKVKQVSRELINANKNILDIKFKGEI